MLTVLAPTLAFFLRLGPLETMLRADESDSDSKRRGTIMMMSRFAMIEFSSLFWKAKVTKPSRSSELGNFGNVIASETRST